MKFCYQCGNGIDDVAVQCVYCGANMPPSDQGVGAGTMVQGVGAVGAVGSMGALNPYADPSYGQIAVSQTIPHVAQATTVNTNVSANAAYCPFVALLNQLMASCANPNAGFAPNQYGSTAINVAPGATGNPYSNPPTAPTTVPTSNPNAANAAFSSQAAGGATTTSAAPNNLANALNENVDVEAVKKGFMPHRCYDMKSNIIFGIGHVVLIVMTFLPWVKSGLFSISIFDCISQMNDSAQVSGLTGAYIELALLSAAAILVVVPNIYGAIARFALKRTFNLAFPLAVLGCILFAIAIFGFTTIIGLNGEMAALANAAMDPDITFYITAVLAIGLSVLGSGVIDIQKIGGSRA